MRLQTPTAMIALTVALAVSNGEKAAAQPGPPRPPGPPMGGFRPGPVMGPVGPRGPVGVGVPGGFGSPGRIGPPPSAPGGMGGQMGGAASRVPGNIGVPRYPTGINPVYAAPPRVPPNSGFGPNGPANYGAFAKSSPLPGVGGLRDLARSGAFPNQPSTNPVNDQKLANLGNQVRNNFNNYDSFRGDWWDRHRDTWRAAAWAAAAASAFGSCGYPSWGDYSGYSGYSGEPTYYDYGSNVVYEGNTVYVNGESAGTQQEYAQQAVAIADSGRQAALDKEEEWLSLGVFAMTQGDSANGNELFQLAVNKAGAIRGNYYNLLTDVTHQVQGSVDKDSQRIAWTIGNRTDPTFETGIANLTRPQTPMLVHFGRSQTQQWNLVRITPPAELKSADASGPSNGKLPAGR